MQHKLKDWMDEQGFDQEAVAGLLGTSQSTVSRVISGKCDPTGTFIRGVYRISDGAIEPNHFFPELFTQAPARAA